MISLALIRCNLSEVADFLKHLAGSEEGLFDVFIGVRGRDETCLELGGGEIDPARQHPLKKSGIFLGVGGTGSVGVGDWLLRKEEGEEGAGSFDRDRKADRSLGETFGEELGSMTEFGVGVFLFQKTDRLETSGHRDWIAG